MQATDQLNRTIEFNFPPKRIISLVPSQSELLWYLGLQEELVGITKFCIHPQEMFRSLTRVGGTKELNFETIKKLQPDLIIANKEENEQSQIEELCKLYPVWISDIYNVPDALQMIEGVGAITNKTTEARNLTSLINNKYIKFRSQEGRNKRQEKSVAYLIWKKPYMAAGKNTFINSLLQDCGFTNVFTNEESRYPEVTTQMLSDKKPDFVFLSSEPYPFKQKDIDELQKHVPSSKIVLVDGEMFSWYGNRLVHAFDYFEGLISKI